MCGRASASGKNEGRNPKRRRSASSRQVKPEPEITDDDEQLLELHAELMKQIQERKEAQNRLKSELQEPLTTKATIHRPPPSPRPSRVQKPTPSKIPPMEPLKTNYQTISQDKPIPEEPTKVEEQVEGNVDRQDPASVSPPPKERNPNAMNIVLVGAECAPWSKTGGLVRIY